MPRRHKPTQQLPSLDKAAVVFKGLTRERLGEVIGSLVDRFNLDQDELLAVLPEPVPFDQEVLGPVGEALVGGKVEGPLVVLKDSGSDGVREGPRDQQCGNNFIEGSAEREQSSEGVAQGSVFGLEGGAGDRRLELGLPKDGAATQQDDVAGARLDGFWGGVRLLAEETCKVSINVEVELEFSIGFHDGAFVFGTLQVSDDGLDCSCMALFWGRTESTNLADGKCNVGAVLVER